MSSSVALGCNIIKFTLQQQYSSGPYTFLVLEAALTFQLKLSLVKDIFCYSHCTPGGNCDSARTSVSSLKWVPAFRAHIEMHHDDDYLVT